MVESSGHTTAATASRTIPSTSAVTATNTTSSSAAAMLPAGSTILTATRCGVLETRVRGAWYRVTVTLESDYLSVSLDETCDPVDHTTTLNGTLG